MRSLIQKYLFALIASIGLQTSLIIGQNLSEREQEIIYTEAIDVINNYNEIINEIAKYNNNNEAEVTKLKDKFINLFLNRKVLIYNDLDPTHQLSEFYETETYITNLTLWYSDGMNTEIDFDELTSNGITHHKENIYYLDIHFSKKIEGNFMNRSLNSNREELSARIAFKRKKNKFSNFKIVGIRNQNSATLVDDARALREINKADYTNDELVYVHDNANSLLLDYLRSLQLIGNVNEPKVDKEFYTKDFLNLFKSESAKVINDIEPDKNQELIEIKEYIQQYKENYPEGILNISLNTDSATYSHIEGLDSNKFQTFVYIDKFFSGNFKGRQKYSFANSVVFTIAFTKEDEVFQHFAINSVDIEYADFSGINQLSDSSEKAKISVEPIKKTGIWIGFTATGAYSHIFNSGLESQSLANNRHEWNVIKDPVYFASFTYYKFYSTRLGLRSGLGYQQYSTRYSLNSADQENGVFEEDVQLTDGNNHRHFKQINTLIDSSIILNYVTAPLGAQLILFDKRKFYLFFEAGLELSYLVSSTYKSIGHFQSIGFYYENERQFQYLYEEELGFSTISDIDGKGETRFNTFNISGYATLGFSFKLGYYSYFSLAPKIDIGLISIDDKELYTNIFGRTMDASTKTRFFGIDLTYIYKL